MPGFLDYPVASSAESTDLLLIYRAGSGTLAIEIGTLATYIENIVEEALGISQYNIAMNYSQSPPPSTTFLAFIANASFSLSTNFAGSQAEFLVGPTSVLSLTVSRNGSSIGSISFGAEAGNAASVGSFTGTATTFEIGDLLEISAPSALFGASNLAVTFSGALAA